MNDLGAGVGLLVVLSTPKVREWLSAFGKKLKQGKAVKEVG